MQTVSDNIWDLHAAGYAVVIPTNTCFRGTGTAVMDAGLAKQAADRFPALPATYGKWLRGPHPEVPFAAPNRLFCLPTKRDWREVAQMDLIESGMDWLCQHYGEERVALPLLGAGLGQLDPDTILAYLSRRGAECPQWVLCLPPGGPR